MIDPILFKDLLAENPENVLDRCSAAFDPEEGAYTVRFWTREMKVLPAREQVICPGIDFTGAWAYVPLILVHYLLSARNLRPEQSWVSEKDLPGGSAFFRGPHTLPTDLVARRFETGVEEFQARCRQLGGEPMEMADAAYVFPLLPAIPAAVLLWQADEMFGAECRLLFDRTLSSHLPLDIVYALGVTLCQVLSSGEPLGHPG